MLNVAHLGALIAALALAVGPWQATGMVPAPMPASPKQTRVKKHDESEWGVQNAAQAQALIQTAREIKIEAIKTRESAFKAPKPDIDGPAVDHPDYCSAGAGCQEYSSSVFAQNDWRGTGTGVLLQSLSQRDVMEEAPFESDDPFASLQDDFDEDVMKERSNDNEPVGVDLAQVMEKTAVKRTTRISPLTFILQMLLGVIVAKIVIELRLRHKKIKEEVQVDEKPESLSPSPRTASGPVQLKKDLDTSVKGNEKLLHEAVRMHDEARVNELLQEGIPADAKDVWGCTALHVAADCKNKSAVAILLEHGADVHMREAWDETPLHFAARSGSAEICELFVVHGAAIDAVDMDGRTPMVSAAHAGHEKACKFLLSHGGGVGGLSDDELPPLLNSLLFLQMFQDNRDAAAATVAKEEEPSEDL